MLVETVNEFSSGYKTSLNKKAMVSIKRTKQIKNGNIFAVTLNIEVQGSDRSFQLGDSHMSLRDNSTGSIYPYIGDYSFTRNPSISKKSDGSWPAAKDYTLLFSGPKNCKNISILYFGEEIAKW